MQKLVLATSNKGKLAELRPLLADAGYDLVTQGELGVADAVEDGRSFVENAIIKARHACVATGLPALADDSGLVVRALGGAPGVLSARYAGAQGDSAANIARLLGALEGVPEAEREAHFYCVLVLLRHADDPEPLIAEGRWHGRILAGRRGAGGFGYDPVFLDTASGLSAAELEPATKNRVSHRGQAIARLRELLGA
ncbi:RdgB/HAM1 family non-canonical purine NTP pyrophosphatase [Arenimonas caeni]|jgi:XTP/dITP diphosphohydrolase|uniref:RdgB/HAM1 family non-canonical purine NTP pyrophosphatase n=1 Tax=Arenimonas caeni TaxID=2058085 RepID=UPI002A367AD1|nr:RdgB/HAM1 family non-canonical purine NTP pyrophosphatase [Arenimonas caeni]MDY0022610.1 RdgB/HAM1 family non-canonical purine NTP pyrophosphatase [Arenimonas caeni]